MKQTRTRKGVNRQFRRWLVRNNKPFPPQGAFALKISGKEVVSHDDLPAKAGRFKVETFPGVEPGNLQVTASKKAKPVPVTVADPDRTLYKRVVREADPDKPGSKRRADYRAAKNPKPDDGVTYFTKVDGRWREVPAAYADPSVTEAA